MRSSRSRPPSRWLKDVCSADAASSEVSSNAVERPPQKVSPHSKHPWDVPPVSEVGLLDAASEQAYLELGRSRLPSGYCRNKLRQCCLYPAEFPEMRSSRSRYYNRLARRCIERGFLKRVHLAQSLLRDGPPLSEVQQSLERSTIELCSTLPRATLLYLERGNLARNFLVGLASNEVL